MLEPSTFVNATLVAIEHEDFDSIIDDERLLKMYELDKKSENDLYTVHALYSQSFIGELDIR
jgi:hypothetical protein